MIYADKGLLVLLCKFKITSAHHFRMQRLFRAGFISSSWYITDDEPSVMGAGLNLSDEHTTPECE